MKKITAIICGMLFLAVGAAYGADVSPEKKAWSLYNAKDYKAAYDDFSILRKSDPQNPEYALGLAYSADKLGKLDETLEVAEAFSKPDVKFSKKNEFVNIKKSVLFKKGNTAYEAKDYKTASAYLQRLHDTGGADNGQTELLAWSYYNDNEIKKAVPYFNQLREKTGEERFTDILFTIYERLGSEEGAAFVLKEAGNGSEKNKKRAALFFFTIGCPVIAAGIDPSEKNCFYNANKPKLTLDALHKSKTGDAGTSKLAQTEASLRMEYPFGGRYVLGFNATGVRLDSGSAPDVPYAGTYPLPLPPTVVNDITTSVNGFYPEISLKREGVTTVILTAGTTPSGGDVSSALTGGLLLKRKRASLEVYRKGVDESILSYVGLKDPYGIETWGRVVRTGVAGEKIFLLDEKGLYWITLKGGYDSYKGKNVLDNHSYNVSLTLGGSYETILADVYAGVYGTYMSFDKSTDYFTFGHGGYFSPERFFIVGPFVNVSTKPCKEVKAWMEASFGYRRFVNAEAARFPFDPSRTETYDEEKVSGAGFSVAGGASKLLRKRFSLGASFKVGRYADFTEWKAGAALTYYFEPVNAVSMY